MSETLRTLGFIGAGQMARALARGFGRDGSVGQGGVVVHDPAQAACSEFAREVPSAQVVDSNAAVVGAAELVFLAVKPQSFSSTLR